MSQLKVIAGVSWNLIPGSDKVEHTATDVGRPLSVWYDNTYHWWCYRVNDDPAQLGFDKMEDACKYAIFDARSAGSAKK